LAVLSLKFLYQTPLFAWPKIDFSAAYIQISSQFNEHWKKMKKFVERNVFIYLTFYYSQIILEK